METCHSQSTLQELQSQVNHYENKILSSSHLTQASIPIELSKDENVISCCYSNSLEKIFIITNKHAFPIDSVSGFIPWKIKTSTLTKYSSKNFIWCDFFVNLQQQTIKEVLILQLCSKKGNYLCTDILNISTGSVTATNTVDVKSGTPIKVILTWEGELCLFYMDSVEVFSVSPSNFTISNRYSQNFARERIQNVANVYLSNSLLFIVKCIGIENCAVFNVEKNEFQFIDLKWSDDLFAMIRLETSQLFVYQNEEIRKYSIYFQH